MNIQMIGGRRMENRALKMTNKKMLCHFASAGNKNYPAEMNIKSWKNEGGL